MQLETALVELRELRGASQTQIADNLGTSRPNVGRIEKELDVRLSTLIASTGRDRGNRLQGPSAKSGHSTPDWWKVRVNVD